MTCTIMLRCHYYFVHFNIIYVLHEVQNKVNWLVSTAQKCKCFTTVCIHECIFMHLLFCMHFSLMFSFIHDRQKRLATELTGYEFQDVLA